MQPLPQAPAPVPTFVRLLAEVLDAQAHQPPRAFYQALEQWLDWTRAVRLSRALDAEVAAGAGVAAWRGEELRAASERARLRLQAHVAADEAWTGLAGSAVPDAGAAFAPLRQHYLGFQRALQASTGQLRGQLRELLAQGSAANVRLAELDAVMEAVLSPREVALFGAVPELLAARFAQLFSQEDPFDAARVAQRAWWGFQREFRGVMLAELEVRFLPIDGLLAALQSL
ncbi:MAG TPA: DUF3348 family protein [Thermomonas sp.]|nr:DUF3348 family protein [Thermomonas sp.]HQY49948.1 DUF3348 family protein [Thermomonas sp.]